MKISLISFTPRGALLARELADRLTAAGHICAPAAFRPYPDETGGLTLPPMERQTLAQWTEAAFGTADALVFVAACGIAVRAVAPYLRSKHTDPAVVAIDETAAFAVALLSGHTGGANRLTEEIAKLTGATPVITTATDRNGLFAIDDWAARTGWRLENPEQVKPIAAALLAGKPVTFQTDFPLRGPAPRHYLPGEVSPHLWFTWSARPKGRALKVIPPALTVGIGCRKGTPREQIAAAVENALASADLSPLAVFSAATIDRKKDEPGLLAYCKAQGWPLQTYPPETLAAQPGAFTASPFVREVTGVDNVCERAAIAAAGENARLLVKKTAQTGVTVAVAARAITLGLEETP